MSIDYCRIGSLEISQLSSIKIDVRLLPHRQLRNASPWHLCVSVRLLPHRQLRKLFSLISSDFSVDYCRIGSLEMGSLPPGRGCQDYCRIGSLETKAIAKVTINIDYCRIGSLEIHRRQPRLFPGDYCRIGSLEIKPPKSS